MLSQKFKDQLAAVAKKYRKKRIDCCAACSLVKDKQHCKYCIMEKIDMFCGRPVVKVYEPAHSVWMVRETPITYEDVLRLYSALELSKDISDIIYDDDWDNGYKSC
jgi:recombinational DNA repair protein RecR